MTPRRTTFVSLLALAALTVAGCSVETSASGRGDTAVVADEGSADADAGDAPADAGADAGQDAADDDDGADDGAAAAAAAGDASASPALPDRGAPDIEQIVMIGDSITVASTLPLQDRFAALGHPDAVIEAQSSKRIDVGSDDNPSGTAIAARLVDEAEWNGDDDHTDELWVIALGTNDLDQYPDAAGVSEAIESLLDEVPFDATVIWVDTYFEGRSDATDLVNEVIRERMAWRGDATVAEWSAEAFRDGVLSDDGVHPTEDGTEVFADTVAAAVDDVLDS